MRRANAGARRLTSMPRPTGSRISANTLTISTSGIDTSSCRSNHAIAKPVMSGRVTTAMTVLMAVSVMLSATSPRNRWLKRFAVVPPGEAASSSMPMPSRAGRSKSTTSPKQITGRRTTWHASATATAFGARATRLKSSVVRSRPRPNMMIASASGSPTVVSTESMRGP